MSSLASQNSGVSTKVVIPEEDKGSKGGKGSALIVPSFPA